MKHYHFLAFCLAAISLGGCAKESNFPEATGKASVRAINSIATSPTFNFLIEERSLGTVDYKIASGPASYDDLEYTFNFEVVLAGDQTLTRVASVLLDVEANKDYTFIISGSIARPDITVWQGDAREWDGTETVFESQFGHTAASSDPVDVYFAPDGVAPVYEERIGTLAFGEVLPVADFAEGEYVLTITTAGPAGEVLFATNPILLPAQSSFLFSIFDADANDLGDLSAALYNLSAGGSSILVDSESNPTVRFFHASKDFGATDIYIDDPLTTPFVADQVFGDVSAELTVTAGELPLTYTTAGSMGSILLDVDTSVPLGTRNHYYVVRTSEGADFLVESRPNRRSIETAGIFGIINTATSQPAVDAYLVPTGELIDDALPSIPVLQVAADPSQVLVAAGSFDLYVTVTAEKTVLAGPISLDVGLGDVLDAIIYENVDPNVVDVVFVPVP
ncbi:MAG: DUF4397 domain-containing protein [Gammaproteobacteria bacterium]|nr:DUF4397 domain-containing protein [Gammaproteobacteria bacterium]